MALAVGSRVGPYEILALIGAGGMGEVYRARDTKLKRDVALKVLPEAFAADTERMARFQREAEVLASLNHPNIAQIYGVEEGALVMELVEGESLKGPMPFEEAWNIAAQIAAGLDYAHEKGIVHRDLKPANLKVTPEGAVKLLDFGLAKAFTGQTAGPGGVDNSTTLTLGATQVGVVLGTLGYMSPEQARGKPVDKRADIWAFGVVLYEMLTGRRLFRGETSAETLAAVIEREPAWDGVDERAQPLLRRCLEKDPKRRMRDIGEAAAWVEQTSVARPPGHAENRTHSRRRGHGLWIGAAIAAVLATAAVVIWAPWRTAAELKVTRFQVQLPDSAPFKEFLSVSPDGRKLVFTAGGAQSGLWVRDLGALEWRRLAGTENAVEPFWSPDSRFLGFTVGDQLKKIELAGGPPQTLYSAPESVIGRGAWNREGVIVFGGPALNPIRRISATGGVAVDLTARNGNDQGLPTLLPDGKHFLYLRDGPTETAGIYAGSLDATPSAQPRQRILETELGVSYSDGYLFFLRENTLMAQPFDAGALQLRGEPVPLAEHVTYSGGVPVFSVSASGVLIYRTGAAAAADSQLTWFDRQGKRIGTFGDPGPAQGIVLSPDGTRATVQRPTDIWRLDFARGVPTRLTFRQQSLSRAVWSPDGNRIIFAAGDFLEVFFEKASTGAGEEKELMKKLGQSHQPSSWSPDGRFLLYSTTLTPDLWLLPLEGDRRAVLLLGTKFNESQGRFSPDMRWIAYTSNETGRNEIYVRPFTAAGASGPSLGEGKWQISKDGGSDPHWRMDGKELIFRAPDGSPTAVNVNGTGVEFQESMPKQLFAAPSGVGDWDVTSDGKRFLMAVTASPAAETPITVVLNWQALLKR